MHKRSFSLCVCSWELPPIWRERTGSCKLECLPLIPAAGDGMQNAGQIMPPLLALVFSSMKQAVSITSLISNITILKLFYCIQCTSLIKFLLGSFFGSSNSLEALGYEGRLSGSIVYQILSIFQKLWFKLTEQRGARSGFST